MTDPRNPNEYAPLPSRKALDRLRYEAAMAALGRTEQTPAEPPRQSYWHAFNHDPAVKSLKLALHKFMRDADRPRLRAALLAEIDEFELKFRLRKSIPAEQ